MIGQVIVMTPEDYQQWLGGGQPNASPAALGEKIFTDPSAGFGCISCHKPDGTGLGPNMNGVFGSTVALANGQSVVADENYLRESIMNPSAKIVKGYPNPSIMPLFQSQMSEEQLMQVIAYIKTLKPTGATGQH